MNSKGFLLILHMLKILFFFVRLVDLYAENTAYEGTAIIPTREILRVPDNECYILGNRLSGKGVI